MNSNSLIQWLTDVASRSADDSGVATTIDFVGTWEAINRGKPSLGQFLFQVEGPLGLWNGGSHKSGTSQPGQPGLHCEYIRSLCPCIPALSKSLLATRQQGGRLALSSRQDHRRPDFQHISPYQPGPHLRADLGHRAVRDRARGYGMGCGGCVVHHRSSRFDRCRSRRRFQPTGLCHPGREISLQRSSSAARSLRGPTRRATRNSPFWHTDGTSDGQPINGSLGPAGWGFMLKLENELTADGRAVGILRYGESYDGSALYRQLAGAHWLLYDPSFFGRINNDLMGVGDQLGPAVAKRNAWRNKPSRSSTDFRWSRASTPRSATRRSSIPLWTSASIFPLPSASDFGLFSDVLTVLLATVTERSAGSSGLGPHPNRRGPPRE